MEEQVFSLLELKRYLSSIKIPFAILVIFNLLYIALGFSTIVFFDQGISAIFSVMGFIGFFVPIAAYSIVTLNVINKHSGTPLDSALAGVLLSLLVFMISELVGFIVASLIFLSIVPAGVVSISLRAHFIGQYLNIANVMLGLVFGVLLAFLGGFFGFIIHEIQNEFTGRAKSIVLGKGNRQRRRHHTKLMIRDVRIFALSKTKKYLKSLISTIKSRRRAMD